MAHKTYEELAEVLSLAQGQVEVGAKYQHYMSDEKFYTVMAVALQEETEAPCVVYQTSHSSGLIWVRNLDDWLSTVVKDGKSVPRFRRIE
ncbi:MAG TPA: DUF1653 domain-containing protein [Patescibacteria group bacterium]